MYFCVARFLTAAKASPRVAKCNPCIIIHCGLRFGSHGGESQHCPQQICNLVVLLSGFDVLIFVDDLEIPRAFYVLSDLSYAYIPAVYVRKRFPIGSLP